MKKYAVIRFYKTLDYCVSINFMTDNVNDAREYAELMRRNKGETDYSYVVMAVDGAAPDSNNTKDYYGE